MLKILEVYAEAENTATGIERNLETYSFDGSTTLTDLAMHFGMLTEALAAQAGRQKRAATKLQSRLLRARTAHDSTKELMRGVYDDSVKRVRDAVNGYGERVLEDVGTVQAAALQPVKLVGAGLLGRVQLAQNELRQSSDTELSAQEASFGSELIQLVFGIQKLKSSVDELAVTANRAGYVLDQTGHGIATMDALLQPLKEKAGVQKLKTMVGSLGGKLEEKLQKVKQALDLSAAFMEAELHKASTAADGVRTGVRKQLQEAKQRVDAAVEQINDLVSTKYHGTSQDAKVLTSALITARTALGRARGAVRAIVKDAAEFPGEYIETLREAQAMAQRELENTGERSLEDLQDLEQLAFLTVQKVENGLGRDATNVEREVKKQIKVDTRLFKQLVMQHNQGRRKADKRSDLLYRSYKKSKERLEKFEEDATRKDRAGTAALHRSGRALEEAREVSSAKRMAWSDDTRSEIEAARDKVAATAGAAVQQMQEAFAGGQGKFAARLAELLHAAADHAREGLRTAHARLEEAGGAYKTTLDSSLTVQHALGHSPTGGFNAALGPARASVQEASDAKGAIDAGFRDAGRKARSEMGALEEQTAASIGSTVADTAEQAMAGVRGIESGVEGVQGTERRLDTDADGAVRMRLQEEQGLQHESERYQRGVGVGAKAIDSRAGVEWAEVDDGRRAELQELHAEQNRAIHDAHLVAGKTDRVGRDIAAQQFALKGDLAEMDAVMKAVLQKIDPSGELSAGKLGVEHLHQLILAAAKQSGLSADQLGSALTRLLRTSSGVEEGVSEEEARMNEKVVLAARSLKTAMLDVHGRLHETADGLEPLMEGTLEAAGELSTMLQKKLNGVLDVTRGTQADVDNAITAEKYGTDEAVKKVIQAVDESQAQADKLNWSRENVIMPGINTWRSMTERVFSSLGLGLDKERINRLAEESMTAEGADAGVLSSKEEIEYKIKQAKETYHKKAQAVRDLVENHIAAVMARTDLTAEEKHEAIVRMRAAAERSINVLAKAAAVNLAKQRGLLVAVEQSEMELDSMLLRVENLKRAGRGSAASKAMMQKLMRDMSSTTIVLQRTLDRVLKEQNADSSERFTLNKPDVYSLLERTASKYDAAAQALRDAETARTAEDEGLDNSLALLETALPQIRRA